MNKKSAIMLIIGIIVTVPIIVGSTYAYYLSTTKSNNSALNTNASNFEVIYTGGEKITGPMNLSKSREQGLNTSVKIKMAEGSALAKANIYINVEKITSNISIDGFIWEVVGIKNGVEVYNNRGTFKGVTSSSTVTIVKDYPLSYEDTTFTVYFWMNGDMVDNSVLNSEFVGTIGASSEKYTGSLQ